MQRRIYYIILFLFIKVTAFSQIEVTMASQFDAVAKSTMLGTGEYVIGAYINNQMFIVKHVNDSLAVTKYITTMYNEIAGVCSISIAKDTLLSKTVDSLSGDTKQNHNYCPYDKDLLTTDNFFLIFYEKDNLQLFRQKEASHDQQLKAHFILRRLSMYADVPFKGQHSRIKYLNIKSWKELLKYLGSGTVDNMSR